MSARGWVESLGIEYSAARTPESTATGIGWLTDLNEHGPRVLEVFSEKIDGHRTAEGLLLDLGRWRREAQGAYRRIRRLGGRVLRRLGLR